MSGGDLSIACFVLTNSPEPKHVEIINTEASVRECLTLLVYLKKKSLKLLLNYCYCCGHVFCSSTNSFIPNWGYDPIEYSNEI